MHRPSGIVGSLIVTMAVGVLVAASGTLPVQDRPNDIQDLIGQLGNIDERQAATRALLKIGEGALVELRKAAKTNTDADVRRQAAEILDQIYRQLARKEHRRATEGPNALLMPMVISPEHRCVVAGEDGENGADILIWNLDTGKALQRLRTAGEYPTRLTLSSDGLRLLLTHAPLVRGPKRYLMRLWDVKTGRELRQFDPGDRLSGLISAAFFWHGKKAVSCDARGTIRTWNLETGTQLRVIEAHPSNILAGAISPDQRTLLTGGLDKTMRLWDLESGKELRRFDHPAIVFGALFSPDCRRAVSAADDGRVRLWDLENANLLRTFEGHDERALSLAFSQNGKRLLSASLDRTARLWEVETGHELRRYHAGEVRFAEVGFSQDGKQVYAGNKDNVVHFWYLPN